MYSRPGRRARSAASLIAIIAFAMVAATPGAAQNPPSAERPTYRPMRYDENWRALADPVKQTEPLDTLKWIEVSDALSLTLGGEARLRGEAYDELDLGFNDAVKSDYLLARLMLHADVRASSHVRGFVQLRVGDAWGAERPLSPVQVNDVDVNQAFVDVAVPTGNDQIGLRLGRQEMSFGSSRMVSVREGPNIRLSFDGARAFWNLDTGRRVDVFYARPVLPAAHAFDDRSSRDYQFWGVYGTTPIEPGLGIDLYYFGVDRSRVAFGQGVSPETRHTLGGRLFGRRGPWDWDLEAAYQFGDFGARSIRAYTFANDFGYTLKSAPWSPRLGLRLDVASGDADASDNRLDTFEVPFPRLPYLTEASFLAPANIIDVHPTLTLNPRREVRLTFDYVAVWKHRQADTFYLPSLRPVAGTADTGRFVGSLVQAAARWDVTSQLSLDVLYTRAYVSDGLKRAGGRDSDFFLVAGTTRF